MGLFGRPATCGGEQRLEGDLSFMKGRVREVDHDAACSQRRLHPAPWSLQPGITNCTIMLGRNDPTHPWTHPTHHELCKKKFFPLSFFVATRRAGRVGRV